jgi:hypothetical protein
MCRKVRLNNNIRNLIIPGTKEYIDNRKKKHNVNFHFTLMTDSHMVHIMDIIHNLHHEEVNKMTRTLIVIAGLLFILSLSDISHGAQRVVVNGVRLNNTQIHQLQQANCGYIPDGNYWLNFNTGIWGYAGDPRPMGRIGDNCYAQPQRKSLSQRGMLFSTWDWVR